MSDDDRDSKPFRPGARNPLDPPIRRAQPSTAQPAGAAGPMRGLRVIKGEGQGRDDTLHSRDDVVRLLVSSAADMLLKRISVDRAHEIEIRVNRIMKLFDRLNADDPIARPLLRRELDDLEAIWREGQEKRKR